MLGEPRESTFGIAARACPECGHTELEIELRVVTKVWVQFLPDDRHEITDVEDGNLDWEDAPRIPGVPRRGCCARTALRREGCAHDTARCWHCSWSGRVGDLAER